MSSNRRKYKTSHGGGASARYTISKALIKHLRSHAASYAPAVTPTVFFILAHGITFPALVLAKTGVIGNYQTVYTAVVTWAVYGLLPLLVCSYIPFFLVARPLVAFLEKRYADWSELFRDGLTGTGYGVVIGLGLVALLSPGSWFGNLSLLVFGTVVGLLNWLFYRKIICVDA